MDFAATKRGRHINNPLWVKFEIDCFRLDYTSFIQQKSALVFFSLCSLSINEKSVTFT